MAKLISQMCGELQPAVCLSRGYVAIWRRLKHSWTSDRHQKQATAKAAWATFSINTCLYCEQLSFDGEKCVLKLCAWNVAFLKSGHSFGSLSPIQLNRYILQCSYRQWYSHTWGDGGAIMKSLPWSIHGLR